MKPLLSFVSVDGTCNPAFKKSKQGPFGRNYFQGDFQGDTSEVCLEK